MTSGGAHVWGLTWSVLVAFALCSLVCCMLVESVQGGLSRHCCVVEWLGADGHVHGGIQAFSAAAIDNRCVVSPHPPVNRYRLVMQVLLIVEL